MNRTSNNICFLMIYLFLPCFLQNLCGFRDLCKKKNMRRGFLIRSLFLHMVLKEISKAITDFLNENHQYFQMISQKSTCLFNRFWWLHLEFSICFLQKALCLYWIFIKINKWFECILTKNMVFVQAGIEHN